jgi:DNA-binding response OmpR family regulator
MSHKFLVIDDNPDSRFLLTKALARKFPAAFLIECGDDRTATAVAATEKLDAIILHRTVEAGGVDMLPHLRRVNGEVPILMVSGLDRSVEARKAGATAFMLYDEWLRLGTVVAGLINSPPHQSRPPLANGEKDRTLTPA